MLLLLCRLYLISCLDIRQVYNPLLSLFISAHLDTVYLFCSVVLACEKKTTAAFVNADAAACCHLLLTPARLIPFTFPQPRSSQLLPAPFSSSELLSAPLCSPHLFPAPPSSSFSSQLLSSPLTSPQLPSPPLCSSQLLTLI